MGYDPAVWGPKFWDTLGYCSRSLSPDDMIVLLRGMSHLLPCLHCRSSYGSYLLQVTPEACCKNEEECMKYVWLLHDMTNSKLGKKHLPFSYMKARMDVFDPYVSPSDILHAMGFMALDVEEEEGYDAYRRVAPLLLKAILKLDPKLDLPSSCTSLSEEEYTKANVWMHALACRNAYRSHRGVKRMTREEFRTHYEAARSPLLLQAPKKRSSSSSSRSGSRVSRKSRRG